MKGLKNSGTPRKQVFETKPKSPLKTINLMCPHCPHKPPFLTLRSLQRHKEEHRQVEISCDKCSKTFKTKEKAERHKLDVHPVDLLQCDLCGVTLKSRKALKLHVSRHENFVCSSCGKSFTDEAELESHKKIHKFPCVECGKVFTRSNDVKRHCRLKHNTEVGTNYCVLCKKNISEKIEKHLKGVHPGVEKFITK